MPLMVDGHAANVVVYGRDEGGVFASDKDAFHAWVERDGWLVDLMSPIMGVALCEAGRDWQAPRRMLQKRLADGKASPGEIQCVGEFYVGHDRALTKSLIDSQGVHFTDLLSVCQAWFRRPPKPLKDLALGDSNAAARKLVPRAPSIEGVW